MGTSNLYAVPPPHALSTIDPPKDNFRIDKAGVVKIIDFGLSRYETTEHTGLTTLIFPCYRFIAPELIIPGEDAVSMFVTKASDVYAFSMTALQVQSSRYVVQRFFLLK